MFLVHFGNGPSIYKSLPNINCKIIFHPANLNNSIYLYLYDMTVALTSLGCDSPSRALNSISLKVILYFTRKHWNIKNLINKISFLFIYSHLQKTLNNCKKFIYSDLILFLFPLSCKQLSYKRPYPTTHLFTKGVCLVHKIKDDIDRDGDEIRNTIYSNTDTIGSNTINSNLSPNHNL